MTEDKTHVPSQRLFIKVSVPAFRNTYRVSGFESGFGTFGAPGDAVTEDEEEEKERKRRGNEEEEEGKKW